MTGGKRSHRDMNFSREGLKVLLLEETESQSDNGKSAATLCGSNYVVTEAASAEKLEQYLLNKIKMGDELTTRTTRSRAAKNKAQKHASRVECEGILATFDFAVISCTTKSSLTSHSPKDPLEDNKQGSDEIDIGTTKPNSPLDWTICQDVPLTAVLTRAGLPFVVASPESQEREVILSAVTIGASDVVPYPLQERSASKLWQHALRKAMAAQTRLMAQQRRAAEKASDSVTGNMDGTKGEDSPPGSGAGSTSPQENINKRRKDSFDLAGQSTDLRINVHMPMGDLRRHSASNAAQFHSNSPMGRVDRRHTHCIDRPFDFEEGYSPRSGFDIENEHFKRTSDESVICPTVFGVECEMQRAGSSTRDQLLTGDPLSGCATPLTPAPGPLGLMLKKSPSLVSLVSEAVGSGCSCAALELKDINNPSTSLDEGERLHMNELNEILCDLPDDQQLSHINDNSNVTSPAHETPGGTPRMPASLSALAMARRAGQDKNNDFDPFQIADEIAATEGVECGMGDLEMLF